MEVIKAQMLKDEGPPPVAPHAPAHGVVQPAALIATNNNVELRKTPRPTSGILRHSGLAAPS